MAITFLFFNKFDKRKIVRIKKHRNFKINLDSEFLKKIDEILKKNTFIYKVKENYVTKLGVINPQRRSINNSIVVAYLTFTIVFTVIISILFSLLFSMWYVVLLFSVLTIYIITYIAIFILNRELKKVQKEFPIALQVFIDYYMGCKNIKVTLTNTYDLMPKKISFLFERLTRQLVSGKDYETPINDFADSLDYIWGYSFAELLLMSYEGVGDIADDLIFLNDLINEDIAAEEETSSELAGNKMVAILINVSIVVAFVFNLLANPIAKELYFYTSAGNNIILFWMIIIVAGLTSYMFLDYL